MALLYILTGGFLVLNALSAQKPITLEDIWSNPLYKTKEVPGFMFQLDGFHYTRLESGAINQYDIRTGKKTATLFQAAEVDTTGAVGWTGQFDGFSFSPSESFILLAVDLEKIYRRSKQAHYFVYNRKTKKLTPVQEHVKQRYVTFSPDESKIAYVLDNDLYIKELASGRTTQVTKDGEYNAIINGASDWVYEEEFRLVRAFEWSPDSKKIAFLRFDERRVPEFKMEMFSGGDYPEEVAFKYPKVGEQNAIVTAPHIRSGFC